MKSVIKNTNNLLFFDKKITLRLQKLANKSEKKRSRICCHLSTRNKINEMVIYLMKKVMSDHTFIHITRVSHIQF